MRASWCPHRARTPIKFRSTYVDGIYDPPRAGAVGRRALGARTAAVHRGLGGAGAGHRHRHRASSRTSRRRASSIATIGDQLAHYGPQAPQLWLPPLDEADPARPSCWRRTEIAERTSGAGRSARSTSPSRCAATRWCSTPASAAGNLLIHGGPKSGKSHRAADLHAVGRGAARTRATSRFYCLDYGGGQLRAMADLAHVGAVASPLEPERIRRTFAELEQLLRARQERGARSGSGGNAWTATARSSWSIDNLYAFSRDNIDTFNTRNPLLARVTELVNTGLSYGIHVVITTPNWLEVPLAMRDGLGLRLELKLNDSHDSNVRVVGALTRPADSGARRSAGPRPDHGRRALPVRGTRPARRSRSINARHPGERAPAVRLLPTQLTPAARRPDLHGPEQVVIGQREEDLRPVAIDFARNPLMMVFGDSRSGKTTLLRHLIRTHPGQLDRR